MIFRKKLLLFIITVCAFNTSNAQNSYTKQDSVIYQKYITEFSRKKATPLGELIALTGKHFLGKPYIASTLEGEGEEKLVVNLREFDCTTFVESSIALSKELKKEDQKSFQDFIKILREMRYRNGKVNGYTSRIHYTSDWIYENLDILENVTVKLGGSIINKPINFMSSNSNLYDALKTSKKNQEKIKLIEQSINKRNNYALLPVAKIRQAEKGIKTGDIIIFGTNVNGLDYSHIGIAVWEGKILKLLHASSARKRVIVDTKSLAQYCSSSKSCTGITILRLKDN